MALVGDAAGWGIALGVAMAVLGHVAHLLKRVVEARAGGEPETLLRYVLAHPYSVALGMIGTAAVMGLLIELGEVSLMGAFAAGYMADSGLEALRATRAGQLARGAGGARGFEGGGFSDGGSGDGDAWQAGPVADGCAGHVGGGPGGAVEAGDAGSGAGRGADA